MNRHKRTRTKSLACIFQETIRLKFRATYEVDGSTQVQAGEVDSFPSS